MTTKTELPGLTDSARPIEKLSRTDWLAQDRFFPDGGAFQRHQARIPADTPREWLLLGEFWSRFIRGLHADDRIEWVSDCRIQYGEIVVVEHDIAGELELRVLWSKTVEPVAAHATRKRGEYEVVWLGAHEQWAVRRIEDGHIMEKNIASAAEGERRILVNHTRKIA